MENKSPLITELSERGYIYQITNLDALNELLQQEKIAAYVGFDCTAKSLHVGNLLQIMLMRKLQQHGHKPIILLGGATSMIGDPSDKKSLRKMLTRDEIEENKQSIKSIFNQFLDFSPSTPNHAIMVDNNDWLSEVKYIEFLRDYGVHFSINRMLTFDSVKLRLSREEPLTFLEFNYMILQAYDFVELNRKYGCKLQFGGSEQWGNIVNGIELGRRMDGTQLFGITTNLITNSSGAKMGKTVDGAVWLKGDMLFPYDYWQFWRNTADADVIKFMKLYTDIPVSDINTMQNNNDINELKKILADATTTMCHGHEAAISARKKAEDIFENENSEEALPHHKVSNDEFTDDPIYLYKILTIFGLCKSNTIAKNMIIGKGVRVNDKIVDDELTQINKSELKNKVKISVGKKQHIIIYC